MKEEKRAELIKQTEKKLKVKIIKSAFVDDIYFINPNLDEYKLKKVLLKLVECNFLLEFTVTAQREIMITNLYLDMFMDDLLNRTE